jgi:hypothetical protein
MRPHRNTAALVLTMTMTCGASLGLGADYSGAAKESRPTITLRVVNEADVDTRILSRAEQEAAAILRRSGVELTSLTCESGQTVWGSGNPCQRERGGAEFWFHIVSRKPATTTEEMLGFTVLGEDSESRSAGVFYPAAIEVSRKYRIDVSEILGAAVAHEVGHLILGGNTHSPRGVMSPQWGPTQFELISISKLSFTSDQSKLLQDEVKRLASGGAVRALEATSLNALYRSTYVCQHGEHSRAGAGVESAQAEPPSEPLSNQAPGGAEGRRHATADCS